MSTTAEQAQKELEQMIESGQFKENLSEVATPGIRREFKENEGKENDKK